MKVLPSPAAAQQAGVTGMPDATGETTGVENKVKVSMGMVVSSLKTISTVDGTFELSVWLRMRWQDRFLKWNYYTD